MRPLGVSCGVSIESGPGILATGPVDSVGYGVESLLIRLVPEHVMNAQSNWDFGPHGVGCKV